jgi:hypothetical protein
MYDILSGEREDDQHLRGTADRGEPADHAGVAIRLKRVVDIVVFSMALIVL